MQQWIYKQGTSGDSDITVSEIAGKEIKGHLYREGIEYRPTQNEDGIPVGKEFSYEIELGKIFFAIPFDGNENLDIPYESD